MLCNLARLCLFFHRSSLCDVLLRLSGLVLYRRRWRQAALWRWGSSLPRSCARSRSVQPPTHRCTQCFGTACMGLHTCDHSKVLLRLMIVTAHTELPLNAIEGCVPLCHDRECLSAAAPRPMHFAPSRLLYRSTPSRWPTTLCGSSPSSRILWWRCCQHQTRSATVLLDASLLLVSRAVAVH
jgi:hypothetical protein